MPPTAATGLAVTLDEPKATAASIDTELVIIPQPRLTVALPPALIPVVELAIRLIAQYFPEGTIVAVALALITGAELMNMPEKLSCFCTDRSTLTASGSAAKAPVGAGMVQVGV